jgi:hypothetical protein
MLRDYGDIVAKLRPDQLVCAITGLFAAIGHEPELTPILADRGRLVARELLKRMPLRLRNKS